MRIQRISISIASALMIAGALLSQPAFAQGTAQLSDEEIRKLLIQQSIAGYSGSCPCPYNVDRGGRRCGKRSAYIRPGGRSPLCYSKDVTAEMIKRYRRSRQ